jgi:hypothetical protein
MFLKNQKLHRLMCVLRGGCGVGVSALKAVHGTMVH